MKLSQGNFINQAESNNKLEIIQVKKYTKVIGLIKSS